MPQAPQNLRPATWEDLIREEATRQRVPPDLAVAIAQQESSLDPRKVSPKGARGIFQLMPKTAQERGVDPDDPVQNIRGGLTHFRSLLDTHQGDVQLALAAYNAGAGAVAKAGGVPAYPETQDYVQKVIGRLGRPAASGAPAAPGQEAATPAAGVGTPPPAPVSSHTPGDLFRKRLKEPPRPMGLKETFSPLLVGMDPRTPGGLRNLGGAIGSAGLAYATGGTSLAAQGLLHGARVAGTAMLGAFGGGALAEGANLLREPVGTPPPSPVEAVDRMAKGGMEQAGYEMLGGLTVWPFKAVARRVIAPRVSRFATEALDAQITQARDALQTTRVAGQEARAVAKEEAGAGVQAAKAAKTDSLGATKGRVAEQLATLEQVFGKTPRLVSSHQAGQTATAAMEGPAKSALDEMGETVRTTATAGPPLSLSSVKQAVASMGESMTPSTRQAGPDAALAGVLGQTFTDPRQIAQQQLLRDIAGPDHPLPGLLGEIQSLPDEISFLDAHKYKRLLDEAVSWDSPAKKQLQQITKGTRVALREVMASHAPYNQATAAYEAILPLYRKGIADEVKRQIVDNPDVLVSLIKSKEPTRLQMWRDLLIGQSAKGGDPELGQRAWDATRAAWTYDELIKGGLSTLGKRLDGLDPDFARVFFGDTTGQAVQQNLRAIDGAYQTALTRGLGDIAETKATGTAAVRAATITGQAEQRTARHETAQQLTGAMEATRGAREARTALQKTSVGKIRPVEMIGADIAKATILGPTSTWGAVAIFHLLKGPKSAELVRYAAFSPRITQLYVDLLTGPTPGLAMADLLRVPGLSRLILGPDLSLRPSHAVGQPPPAAPRIGQAPPAPAARSSPPPR